MASATTINGFPVPLTDNTGWFPDGEQGAAVDDFVVTRFGQVLYKQVMVAEDSTYAAAVHATAASNAASEAAAAIAAMP